MILFPKEVTYIMYKIAIVEDEWDSAERLGQCLETYGKEKGVLFNITRFKNGLNFIEDYRPNYDIIFMDVDMPHKNGLDTARDLRRIDPAVVLIFVTFLGKYAIKGYEVDALSYMIKPVNYNAFKIVMDRAISRCAKKDKASVTLPSAMGTLRVELSCLNYIEIADHDITYHTSQGEYPAYGTMRAIEKLLPAGQFARCNRGLLVNLRNVTRISGNHVYVGEEELEISRTRKQAFLDAFHDYSVSE